MQALEEKAISVLLSIDERENLLKWDFNTPQKVDPQIRSYNRDTRLKMKHFSIDQVIKSKRNENDKQLVQLPKIRQREHSFKELMDSYFNNLNRKKQNHSKEMTNRFRNVSLHNYGKQNKNSSPEILILDYAKEQKQLKLSEICKEIMIFQPIKNLNCYLPKLSH